MEDDSPISNHTELNFYDIIPSAQQLTYQVKRGIVETDDNRIMSISGITGSEFEFFEIDKKPQITYKPSEGTPFEIMFEMNLDRMHNTRSVYTIFNALGDYGGLQGLFFSAGALVLGYFNF